MFNAKLAPLVAAQSEMLEMSDLLPTEDEANGESALLGGVPGAPRGKDGGGKVSHGDGSSFVNRYASLQSN